MDNFESVENEVKRRIWAQLVDYIASTDYTQAELAQILNVYPPDVSNLLHGKWDKFSLSKLIRYAGKLDLQVRFDLVCPIVRQNVTRVLSF